MSLTIEQMREILGALPVWIKERDGKNVEYSPTHFNRHPDAPIKWIWNDESVTAICFMEQNYPNSWYDISEIRATLADHDRTDKVSDIRNHISPNTRVSEHNNMHCQHGYDVACLICNFGTVDGKRVWHNKIEPKKGDRVKVDFISESRTIYSGKRFTGYGVLDRVEDGRVFGRLDDGTPFMCLCADVEVVEQ